MHTLDRRGFLASTALLGITGEMAVASDWNQWRGPGRNGQVSPEPRWPSTLNNLELVWETPLGPSYSGPIVSGDSVFVTETVNKKSERVTSFHRETGEQIWQTDWPGSMSVPFFARANGSWIRATPAVSHQHLLVGGIRDVLVCLNPATGQEIWRNDFVESQNTKLPSFGFVSSPLIDGEHAFVQAGGGLLKLELATGQVVWRSLDDGGGMYGSAFSSPVLQDLLGERQLLVQTRQDLAGVDPESGKVRWSVVVPSFRGMNILPPTVYGDLVFTSTYRNGSFGFQVSRRSDGSFAVEQKWKNRVQGYMSSPILLEDHVYLHLSNGRLACMQLETGNQKWSSRPFGKYWSSIAQGQQMLALDERGDLLLVSLNPTEFRLLGTRKVADNSWAHLALSDDMLFVRDLEKLLVYRWTG